MMSTPLFLFGMKLFRQQGFIEFFDADFCNTITVQSNSFTEKTLGECCNSINSLLVKAGFKGKLLHVGNLKGLGDGFDLKKILVREDFKVRIFLSTFLPKIIR